MYYIQGLYPENSSLCITIINLFVFPLLSALRHLSSHLKRREKESKRGVLSTSRLHLFIPSSLPFLHHPSISIHPHLENYPRVKIPHPHIHIFHPIDKIQTTASLSSSRIRRPLLQSSQPLFIPVRHNNNHLSSSATINTTITTSIPPTVDLLAFNPREHRARHAVSQPH